MRIGPVGAVIAALVIAAVTLAPGGRQALDAPNWCVICGARATADFLRNIILFVPLGLALRLSGWPLWRVIPMAALFSFGIELAQVVIPGRDPSISDITANTLGAAAGAWGAGSGLAWLVPAPARALRLAVAWCVLVLGVIAATRWLMVLSLPTSMYYGQWVPQLGHLSWYGGTVRRVTLAGQALPDGPLEASAAVRASLLAGDTLTIDAVAGPLVGGLASVFSIADDRGREIVLAGADGEDLVVRFRSRATWLRLEQPALRMIGALRPVPGGADLIIRAWHFGPDLCLELNGQRACPRLTPLRAWTFLTPESWLPVKARRLVTFLWAAGLVLPACYWLVLALWRGRSRA